MILKLFGFFVLLPAVFPQDLPPDFPRCHIDDPVLSSCILKATETVRDRIRNGIPELGIPSLNPLSISQIDLEQGTKSVNYKVQLTNITIRGMDQYKFTHFSYDPNKLLFHADVSFNSLGMDANYKIDGRLLLVRITGEGPLTSVIGKCGGTLDATGKLVKRDGEEYFQPTSSVAALNFTDAKFNYGGLFGDNEELSRITNQALNANSKELVQELTPAIEVIASKIILNILSGFSKNVPYKKLLPPLP